MESVDRSEGIEKGKGEEQEREEERGKEGEEIQEKAGECKNRELVSREGGRECNLPRSFGSASGGETPKIAQATIERKARERGTLKED